VPYLTETDRRLLSSVVDAFPTGEIQVDTVPVGVAHVEMGPDAAQIPNTTRPQAFWALR